MLAVPVLVVVWQLPNVLVQLMFELSLYHRFEDLLKDVLTCRNISSAVIFSATTAHLLTEDQSLLEQWTRTNIVEHCSLLPAMNKLLVTWISIFWLEDVVLENQELDHVVCFLGWECYVKISSVTFSLVQHSLGCLNCSLDQAIALGKYRTAGFVDETHSLENSLNSKLDGHYL